MSFAHLAYRLLMAGLTPLLPLWLKRRARVGKEDISRLSERYGNASIARPQGKLFWMHGASVGEVMMLLPLIKALISAYPKAHILITSGTVTSANLLTQRLPENCIHQYAPFDSRKFVKRFLDHWQPDLAIWAESEIWPNLVFDTKARNIPMALLNARLSQKSLTGWARQKRFAATIFSAFDYIQAADKHTADGLSALTGQALPVYASLKEAAAPLPYDTAQQKRLQSALGSRPIWCAASTHKGEDEIILRAHAKLLKTHPQALLLLAPRHPTRRQDIALLASKMIKDAQSISHSSADIPSDKTQIYIFDTIGDMGLAFSLSSVSVMCGSLIDGLFGHNPLEPARQKNAILTGPNIESFKPIYKDMFAFGAADTILDDVELTKTISDYFSNPKTLAKRQSRAFEFAQSRHAILDITAQNLAPLIDSESQTS